MRDGPKDGQLDALGVPKFAARLGGEKVQPAQMAPPTSKIM